MNVGDLIGLYDYYYWATQKILEQAEKVTPEQWSGPPPIGPWSLQHILVHTLNAERAWRNGWQGLGPSDPLTATETADAQSLARRWHDDELAMRAYLASLTDESLQGPFYDQDVPDPYILWEVIAHVSYHGMQHRSEAAMLLTHFGHSPGSIDMVFWLDERAAREREDADGKSI